MYSLVFFGSFQDYSNQVLEKLLSQTQLFSVLAVVTTPPRPSGRNQELTPTKTHTFARKHHLPVFPLENLDTSSLKKLVLKTTTPDFLISAGYGKLIPPDWLSLPKVAPINVHLSFLPDYPGRFPAEWAILMGETETGTTIIRMSEEFDKGEIITREKVKIDPLDTRQTLYSKLYNLGGELAVQVLPKYASGEVKSFPQIRPKPPKYARQITREDGFIPWDTLRDAAHGVQSISEQIPLLSEIENFTSQTTPASVLVDRMLRAFTPWPGVWTIHPTGKRLKILEGIKKGEKFTIEKIQFEGKNPQPAPYNILA